MITTFENEDSAREVSETLVREGAAACASMLPVRSMYVWDGALQDVQECMVLFKTSAENAQMLRGRLEASHPYQTPEILQVDADHVSRPYHDWLVRSASRPRTAGSTPPRPDG